MATIGFDTRAATYEEQALVQRSAADALFDLLSIQPHEDVLDLGCGPGHLTASIADRTAGRVLGLDASPGMIAQAGQKYGQRPNLRFAVADATRFQVDQPFDAIFCNSAFQWLSEPCRALACCLAALKPGGRLAVQAPAGTNWCPNFLAVLEKVRDHPD
ncbi:MAG TPA: methyltransferase domain-containing protein, partial [Spirochaetia bacterium]|nr:methyltransferase domain-containing protein [Spirochaetia bacterium]